MRRLPARRPRGGKLPVGKLPARKRPVGKLPDGKLPVGKLPVGKLMVGKLMVDFRVLPGLSAGLAGAMAGVGAVVLGEPVLAALAAVCALVAGAASVLLLHRVHQAEEAPRSGGEGSPPPSASSGLVDGGVAGADSPVDAETGLPDERFFALAVEGRVAAARRQLWPVTVVLLEVGLGPGCQAGRDRREALAAFAALVRATLREADVACRTGDTTFGLVLENTGEEGGVWTAERLQIALAQDVSRVCRLAAGVATYPSHALRADEVLRRARGALARAAAAEAGRGLGQVEVARADLA